MQDSDRKLLQDALHDAGYVGVAPVGIVRALEPAIAAIRKDAERDLRDWFAGQALAGLLANPSNFERECSYARGIIEESFVIAREMMKERAKHD